MPKTKYRWMPHLENAVPEAGQGKRISTYNIALEGWRRGLDLQFYGLVEEENKLKVRYSLSNKDRTHYFSLSMGDKISETAFDICNDKEQTKLYLSKYDVPVPQGKMFGSGTDDDKIVSFALSLGFPLVVKPTDGNAGKGVFSNIQSEKNLREILIHVRAELGFDNIIVEQYKEGEEFRIVVIGDKVIGAMNRRPANVVGDGKHSIRQLINIKNDDRLNNPHLTSRLIKKDREVEDVLNRAGYSINSVPTKGKRVYLRLKSNLSAGGEAVDVTEGLTDELKTIAINAGKAIPGLAHYGVDMIVDKKNNTGTILEVNARPGIGGHLFPVEGTPRDFAKYIIDYYFPETVDVERTNLYFDFDSILESLKSRSAEKVQLSKTPFGKLFGKKYIISGRVQKVGYRKWITRKAREYNLHGYTKNLNNGNVVVVVASPKEYAVNDFKEVCKEGPEKANVSKVIEKNWNKPVKIGFELITENNDQIETKNAEQEKVIKRLMEEKKEIAKERRYYKKRYKYIIGSRSWKLTYPIRYISAMLQNKQKPSKEN